MPRANPFSSQIVPGIATLLVIVTSGLVALRPWQQTGGVSASVPLPFAAQTSTLAGSIVQIGVRGSAAIPVKEVRFDNADGQAPTQETLSPGAIYLVYADSVEPDTLDAALSADGSAAASYYGYKYTSNTAAQEKQHSGDAAFAARFPGQFFASEKAQQDPQIGPSLAAFTAQNGVAFQPTGTEQGAVGFSTQSLYVLVVTEPTGVHTAVRNPATGVAPVNNSSAAGVMQ